MPQIKDPPQINFNLSDKRNPGRVLVDADMVPFGTVGNPLAISATLVATSNLSIGPTGSAVPADATLVGGPDSVGVLRAPLVLNAAPSATDYGLVVRGVGLALDSTLTSGSLLAQVAGTGTAGTPAAGVVTVQGIAGGVPFPVSLDVVQIAAGVLTVVSSSVSSVQILAANTSRKGVIIFNNSTQALCIKYGSTASSNSFTVQLAASGYWEMPWPIYTGVIDGIWAGVNGNAQITEL